MRTQRLFDLSSFVLQAKTDRQSPLPALIKNYMSAQDSILWFKDLLKYSKKTSQDGGTCSSVCYVTKRENTCSSEDCMPQGRMNINEAEEKQWENKLHALSTLNEDFYFIKRCCLLQKVAVTNKNESGQCSFNRDIIY